MEEQGELERVPHPDDARARLVQLTAAGRKNAKTVEARTAAQFEAALGRLEVDPAAVIDALKAAARATAAG